VALAAYVFLYAPIAVLVALSFNSSRTVGLVGRLHARVARQGGQQSRGAAIAAEQPAGRRRDHARRDRARYRSGPGAASPPLQANRGRRGRNDAPTVAPEIVLAASLLLLFASVGLRLGFASVILAHVGFTVSYAFLVVKARIAGFDHSLERPPWISALVPCACSSW